MQLTVGSAKDKLDAVLTLEKKSKTWFQSRTLMVWKTETQLHQMWEKCGAHVFQFLTQ